MQISETTRSLAYKTINDTYNAFENTYEEKRTDKEKLRSIQDFFNDIQEPGKTLNIPNYKKLIWRIEQNKSFLAKKNPSNLETKAVLEQNMQILRDYITNDTFQKLTIQPSDFKKSSLEESIKKIDEELKYYQNKFSLGSHYWNLMTNMFIDTDYSWPFRLVGLGISPFVLLYSLWQKINQKK